jgi:hypothetical protein
MGWRVKSMRALLLVILMMVGPVMIGNAVQAGTNVTVFSGNTIHFAPDSTAKYDTPKVQARDNGRVIARSLVLPRLTGPMRITAHLVLTPIPQDELVVFDKWDRAGNIRLFVPDGPDVELVKFITSYGGRTEHDVDVSYLAPLLTGEQTILGFVDTWVTPAWTVDFTLRYESDTSLTAPDFAQGVLYEESFTNEAYGTDGIESRFTIPDDLARVKLFYFVSGHCTDGHGADEFQPKDNVMSVDGYVVYRYQPWRDDCLRYRAVNPYTRRWSDGYWSSDYSRSGWCPGAEVLPLELDLTDHLTPGDHAMRFVIEDIRPKDEQGNYGYWRVSAVVVGWKEK